MADINGLIITLLRDYIQDYKLAEVENKLLSSLNSDEEAVYRTVLINQWLPCEVIGNVMAKTAVAIFPDMESDAALRQLGRLVYKESIRGVYAVIMKIISPRYFMKFTPKLWRMFSKRGTAKAYLKQGNVGGIIVEGFPELPWTLREAIHGFNLYSVERLGGSDVQVTIDTQDPNAWKWEYSWK
jgi:hypothetical protein